MSFNNKNIVWLASYPKSGNTWVRILLSNFLSESEQPVNINKLSTIPIASSRQIFDSWLGTDSSDLTIDEINNLRPEVYRDQASCSKSILYYKVHDAWHLNTKQLPIFPQDISKGVIYIVRNPYDVAVSYASHNNTSLEKSIKNLNNPTFKLSGNTNKLNAQLCQKLFSWSEHISSWTEKSNLPVHIVRYEDLVLDTITTFSHLLTFLGITASKDDIRKAVRFSQFSELMKQERESGFIEKPINAKAFFRKGTITSKRILLNDNLYTVLVKKHHEMMEKFGYPLRQ